MGYKGVDCSSLPAGDSGQYLKAPWGVDSRRACWQYLRYEDMRITYELLIVLCHQIDMIYDFGLRILMSRGAGPTEVYKVVTVVSSSDRLIR